MITKGVFSRWAKGAYAPGGKNRVGPSKVEFAPDEINRNEYIVSPLIRILI